MLKLAIAVPVYDKVEPAFFQSIMSAVSYFYETKLCDDEGNEIPKMIEVFVVGGIIQEARHRLLTEAVQFNADYLLWADSDHVFPADTIPRLLAHQKDIVGCNYARRVPFERPTAPVAARLNRNDYSQKLCYTTKEKADAGELEKVDHLGLGLTLMHMSVMEALVKQADAEGRDSFMPLFHWEDKDPGNGKGTVGEDVFFFQKCREAGLDVWCDHALSWEVGHITKAIFTHAHCERDRERWENEG
jgi:hypothetical protein